MMGCFSFRCREFSSCLIGRSANGFALLDASDSFALSNFSCTPALEFEESVDSVEDHGNESKKLKKNRNVKITAARNRHQCAKDIEIRIGTTIV